MNVSGRKIPVSIEEYKYQNHLRERKQNLNEKNKSFENAYGVDVIDNVHDCTCYKRFALPPQ